jgi:hypothetical protein
LKKILEQARGWAAEGDFASIRELAQRSDDTVDIVQAKIELEDERLAGFALLTRQVCAVLSYVGDSQGKRDSGYFRAALAHARRLDAMTGNTLQLEDLVNEMKAAQT